MQISYTLFLVELGLSFQPFQAEYKRCNFLVTHSWMKMLWEKVNKFGITVIVPSDENGFPREGDEFIMQEIIKAGYTKEELRRLNRVRVSLQVLFMSDILTASGSKICNEILTAKPRQVKRSRMLWPNEQPTPSDMELWRRAMRGICPSSSPRRGGVGRFTTQTHRIWRWFWNDAASTLHRINGEGSTEDVFVAGKKPNRIQYSHTQPREQLPTVCSVQPTLEGDHWQLLSTAQLSVDTAEPATIFDVLKLWGNSWLWDSMNVSGGTDWIHLSINKGTLVAVTDGSYMRELYPHLCSAAFVLECGKGRGRITGSFSEGSAVANAYRGELLGLMAIHLLLLSVNKIHPQLKGMVEIVSDCLGALNRVAYLPPYRIPARCRHSVILKMILLNCRDLSFNTHYSHVKAHQDEQKSFQNLSRKAQLNCICNNAAKFRIMADGREKPEQGKLFPLETVGIFVGGEKMTTDTGGSIRYWAHFQLAREYYHDHHIPSHEQFDANDWRSIHKTLHDLPCLFQLWASKHVSNIAGTMKFLSHQDGRSTLCLSCHKCDETCKHIARCTEGGRMEAFMESTNDVERWMDGENTNPSLARLLLQYLRGRGNTSCLECATDLELPDILREYAASQDVIGWDGFVMGMISHQLQGYVTDSTIFLI
jgi:hypothetical protein